MHQTIVDVTYEELHLEYAYNAVKDPSAGAVASFVGTTRDNFNGKKVIRLEYEAYESMAKSEMHKICDQMREKWPAIVGIAMLHRLGVVEVEEASVVIAVSSPHRKDAIDACEFAIDTVKTTVPIWKKEMYEGDDSVWKENAEWKASENMQ